LLKNTNHDTHHLVFSRPILSYAQGHVSTLGISFYLM
jgi:hypothetical protein